MGSFDTSGPDPASAPPSVPPPSPERPRQSSAPSLVSVVWLAALLVATLFVATLAVVTGLGTLSAAFEAVPTPQPTTSPNVPPAGEIWFGNSADSGTAAVEGHTSRLRVDESFAMVIHLTRVMDESGLTLQLSLDGQLIGSQPFSAFQAGSGSSEVWAFRPGESGFPAAGVWTLEVIDNRTSEVLASGMVTVER